MRSINVAAHLPNLARERPHALAVVSLVPRTVHETGTTPPVRMLLMTAVIVGAICAAALVLGLRFDLGLPWNAVVYTVAFNVLVVVVKLALAPRGFYEVNQVKDIDSTIAIDNTIERGSVRSGVRSSSPMLQTLL